MNSLGSTGEDDFVVHDIAGFRCRFELGRWTLPLVAALIADGLAFEDRGSRLLFHARSLIGTPVRFESKRPCVPPGTLRICLTYFDCMSLVLTAVALAAACDLDSFVTAYAKLRYHDPERLDIDEDPDTGTIYSFAYEGLVWNAQRRDWVLDATAAVAQRDLTRVLIHLEPMRRSISHDRAQRWVRPRQLNDPFPIDVLGAADVGSLRFADLRSGDIVVFRKHLDNGRSMVADHAIIVDADSGAPTFIHASRGFHWQPDPGVSEKTYTGHYYHNDLRREQLGVCYGGTPLSKELQIWVDGFFCPAQNGARRRTVEDYVTSENADFIVLRP